MFLNESEVLEKPIDNLSDPLWNSMRANPENPSEFEKYKEYFSKEKAREMVGKTIDVVASVFNDDQRMKTFMERIAAVESCYGTNPKTYKRPHETKGIFQLDKKTALKTIGYKGQPSTGNWVIKGKLSKAKQEIKKKLGLDWDLVPYESLSKPLYNALACRMFLEIKTEEYKYDKNTNKVTTKERGIPEDLEGQAKWWKERYNTSAGGGTVEKFKKGCNI